MSSENSQKDSSLSMLPGVLIMGSGAMACLFAARLSSVNIPVTIYAVRSENVQALKENGVCLVDKSGNERFYPITVVSQSKDCCDARYALVTVKSWQTQRTAWQLAECLASDGLTLTLQNGLGNREQLAHVLGAERVTLGVTTIGATSLGPGRVQQAGEGVISLSAHPRLAPLSNLLQMAGFIIDTAPNATVLLWGKLVINAAINPITALLGVPNGELLKRPHARALLQATAREAASVAVAQGVQLPYPDPVIAAETIARNTAENRSSMLQDVQRGGPTEIDAICGAIVRAGEHTGVPTPINRTLWQLVKGLLPESI
jgi:2-dehydropantoate 2-reductase